MMRTHFDPIRVLLVEDQDSEATLVIRLLAHASHQAIKVAHANSIENAIKLFGSHDFDVCLLDLGLPDGKGIDSLHQISALDARLPIVVLTGNDDEELGLTAIETGAQDFVAKDAISGQLLVRSLRFSIARQQKMLGHAADANTDVLTGLPNRRQLNENYRDLSATCDELCLALLDIDHFKQFNDTHGHLVGDQVLRHLAEVIRHWMDDQIRPARFGGEEFAFLLPEKNLEAAKEIVSGLLFEIANSPLEINGALLRVTASAGISSMNPQESLEDFLRRTDQALYEAKYAGRNRVCVESR